MGQFGDFVFEVAHDVCDIGSTLYFLLEVSEQSLRADAIYLRGVHQSVQLVLVHLDDSS